MRFPSVSQYSDNDMMQTLIYNGRDCDRTNRDTSSRHGRPSYTTRCAGFQQYWSRRAHPSRRRQQVHKCGYKHRRGNSQDSRDRSCSPHRYLLITSFEPSLHLHRAFSRVPRSLRAQSHHGIHYLLNDRSPIADIYFPASIWHGTHTIRSSRIPVLSGTLTNI